MNICPTCGNIMSLIIHKPSKDKIIWRCHKRNPPHDIKINIREGSVFEGFQLKISVLYFLLYFCFIENLSIKGSFIKCNDFCNQIDESKIISQGNEIF